MLDVINLGFDYQDIPLLSRISLHLPAGGLLHLRGANGAGKSTLLKLVAGLYQPSQGEIQFMGNNIQVNQAAYQQQLCFVGHKAGINPYLTLREYCFYDLNSPLEDTLLDLLTRFNLVNHCDLPCGLLSAGQKRQAGLLRLWTSLARLWLLDEPLVALDENSLALIMEKIALHRAQGGAVLLTSHQNLPCMALDFQEFFL